MPRAVLALGLGLATISLAFFDGVSAGRIVQPQESKKQHRNTVDSPASSPARRAVLSTSSDEEMIEVAAAGALLCYVDTAEYFAQAWAVPSEHQGTPMSCYSYDCADGHLCSAAFSHGWESTKQCEERRQNPAFKNVECCHGVGCNKPTDSGTWAYIGPLFTTETNLACYINDIPDCTTIYQPIPGCVDKAVKAGSVYSAIYGPWVADSAHHRDYACVRYKPLEPRTGKQLAGWTYTVVDRASCDLVGTSGKLGASFSRVAEISSSLCCTENDCNAPNESFDQMTVAGPTMAAAVAQESASAPASGGVIEVGVENEQVYDEAAALGGPQRHLAGMNAPARDDAAGTFIRQPLSIPKEYQFDATPDLTQNMIADGLDTGAGW